MKEEINGFYVKEMKIHKTKKPFLVIQTDSKKQEQEDVKEFLSALMNLLKESNNCFLT